MDWSLLFEVTPWMPMAGCVAWPNEDEVAAPAGVPGCAAPNPPAPPWPPGTLAGPPVAGMPGRPPGIAPPTGMIWKSSLAIGSLYFFRRNFCSTRTSRVGGKVFA